MKKFYLFCDAGMSTSLMAKKMENVAKAHNLDIEVKAFSVKLLDTTVEEARPDVVLLGPQVRHLLANTQEKMKAYDIPVGVVDTADYGAMDGERVLKRAILLLKQHKEGRG